MVTIKLFERKCETELELIIYIRDYSASILVVFKDNWGLRLSFENQLKIEFSFSGNRKTLKITLQMRSSFNQQTRSRYYEKKVIFIPSNIMACHVLNKPVDPSDQAQNDLEESIKSTLSNLQYINFIRALHSNATLKKFPIGQALITKYLIHEKEESKDFRKVIYLPAIDVSPINLDTVLEMLLLSKAISENMGLAKTEVLVDQAIYVKAVKSTKI